MSLIRLIAVLAVALLPAMVFAQNGGMMTVRATVVGSMHLEVESSGQNTSGPGVATYAATLGSIADTQSAPAGFTRAHDEDKTTLTSTIQTRALKANMPNVGYTLRARLQRPAPAGVTWRVNGVEVSADAASSVASGTFGNAGSLVLNIDVNDSAITAPLDNAIVLDVVPN